ncbi:MAG: hypothetical protein IJX83_13085 [Lachnospiraceae bacterium]|nr:hypothetical protein [Lachnospiraceae bacterium]
MPFIELSGRGFGGLVSGLGGLVARFRGSVAWFWGSVPGFGTEAFFSYFLVHAEQL